MRQTPDPVFLWHASPLTTATHIPAQLRVRGHLLGGDLCPPASGRNVEYTDVAALQQLQWPSDLSLLIELRGLCGAEAFKPRRIDKIRDKNLVDFVAKAVILTCVTYFVSIERTRCGLMLLDEYREIYVGIAQHLKQLMT